MLSAAHPLWSSFLLVSGGLFLIVFALPLLCAPLRWARWFGWTVPADTRLTTYFGRCVGGLAVAMVVAVVRAAPAPERHLGLYELAASMMAILTGVHVVGAIERSQPPAETWEILMYAAMTALFVWARLALG
jgi:hypothetical protein